MKMRRIVVTLVVLAMILVYLPMQARAVDVASGTCGENLTWKFTDDGTLTISGTGAMEDYEGSLGAPWSEYKPQVKKVIVEEGVTYLGDYAFSDCKILVDMDLPDSLISTGKYVFAYSSALLYVDFAGGNVLFGLGAFMECHGLTSITFPETMTQITEWMFFNCEALQEINIPGNLDSIGYNAFYGYAPLTVTFTGDMPKEINFRAFEGRDGVVYYPGDNPTWSGEKLKENSSNSDLVWIPTGDVQETVLTTGQYGMNLTWEITNLGKLTLSGTGPMEDHVDTPWINYMDKIISLKVESGITEIDDYAFNSLTKLMTVEIGDTVKSVGQYAFSSCNNLKSVTFLGTVETIRQRAFMHCMNLSEIKFCGDAPKDIDDYAFTLVCATCYYPADNDTWGPEVMLYYDGSIVWEPYGEVVETIVASGTCGENLTWKLNSKGGLIISGTGAMTDFYKGNAPWSAYKNQIKVVKIQNGVSHIGAYAFYDYPSIYRVSLGTTLQSIGEGAFYGNGLTNLIFPNSLQSIGDGAFADCAAIPEVNIPASVTNIGFYAFSGCSSLEWIGVDITNPVYKSDGGVLYTKDGYTLLQCPAGYSYSNYQTLYECVYVIPEAFAGCNNLTYVAMSNVEILGVGAFVGCKNLREISFGYGKLTQISDYSFAQCESLKAVEFPNGTAQIADFAFQGCTGLESVTFPTSLIVVGEKAFDGCTALKQITFNGGAPAIAADAFTGVTAKAVYPYDGKNWNSAVMLGYGGNLSWEKGQKPLVGIFASGKVTSSIKWTIYNNGLLVLSGYGAMPNYSESQIPSWYDYQDKVTDVVIEEGITSLDKWNFINGDMKSIQIPASVKTIADDTFVNCNMLRKIVVASNNKNFASDSGVLYNKAKTEVIWCPRGYAGELTLAPTTQSIRAYAFQGCRYLTSVVIPGSVKQIGDYAFKDCLGTIQFTSGTHTGLVEVHFEGDCPEIGANSFTNVRASIYYPAQNPTWTQTVLQNYGGTLNWVPVCTSHTFVAEIVQPDCIHLGTKTYICSVCGEVQGKPEQLAPLGHDYGLAENGKDPDFWDTTCDVCGAERVVDKHRPTHSMYRMYNPNSGEHFYTGSKEERQMLEAAGWKYEGVGFTFPASTGKPVYRLFQPSTGEHLYTMDEKEKADLLAAGWNYEGIAFNSGNENEVPQYRLWNPNVSVGAYHFTASMEERNVLLAAGWQDQGIGFYTCWQ